MNRSWRLALCLLCCTLAFAQDPKKPAPAEAAKPKPLAEGQIRVLKAVVMEVKGTAQARASRKEKWRDLKKDDVLKPGVSVRTGRKSHVALRIGLNASMLIDRQTRVSIPEIIQKGKVLKTRVTMKFGKADLKVDVIGLDNDFGVSTPTATLAVRGTSARLWWDAINLFRVIGVPANKLRAIEVRYLNGVNVDLSRDDRTSQMLKLPALERNTILWPLRGAVGEKEYRVGTNPGFLVNPIKDTGLDAAYARRGSKLPPTGPTGN